MRDYMRVKNGCVRISGGAIAYRRKKEHERAIREMEGGALIEEVEMEVSPPPERDLSRLREMLQNLKISAKPPKSKRFINF